MQYYKLSFTEGNRKVCVTCLQPTTGFPIAPGGTLNQVINLFVYLNVAADGNVFA